MSQDRKDGSPSALHDLLDAFGGDPARWPPHRRAAGETLLETDEDAQRLAIEARALDQALSAAPLVDAARQTAIAASLIALAANEAATRPRSIATSNNERSTVIDLASARRTSTRTAEARRLTSSMPFNARGGWARAGMALAASLALGLFLGSAAPIQGIESVLGFGDRDAAEQLVMSLQNGHLATVLDEDAL